VRSVVGRFLEHSRAFYFENGGSPELYCASADWMERNFFRRVEVAFPIQRESHRQRILEDLTRYLDDNLQAWTLLSDGRYERLSPGGERPRSAQVELLGSFAAGMSITVAPAEETA
jgi:polyphosphate kinase